MRSRSLALALLLIAFAVATMSRAYAAHEHECGEEMTTVMSLHHCVHHAIEMGHISNAGVGNSLLSKVDVAQLAVDREQPGVAARILEAFINEVEAQTGIHVEAEHAGHLVMHAEMVIDGLLSPQ